MMKRNITRLHNASFDVVIIGAGIYGATISRLLTRNGYTIALIDKGDFSQATSANSLKILHGGLRYLQHLNLKRMRESVICRRQLMQFSPHLVRPLSCLMPTQGYTMRSKPVMATALLLNDLTSWDRNRGLAPALRLPRGTTLAKTAFSTILPGLQQDDVTGAANWFDGLAENTERIVLEHLHDAADYGACLANYVQADRIMVEKGHVTGVLVTNQLTQQQCAITTQLVINAAGPWFSELLQQSEIAAQPVSWAKAMNIVVKKQLHPTYAIGLESREGYLDKDAVFKRGKRLYFFIPWHEHTMIGTTYTYFPAPADKLKVQQQDIDEIIDEVNAIYPDYRLCHDDVSFVHCGLVPMSNTPDQDADVQLEKNSQIIDHEQEDGHRGLISVKGVKYTTAPHAAQKVLQLAQQKLSPSTSTKQPHTHHAVRTETKITPRLQKKYGRFAPYIMPYTLAKNGNIQLHPDRDIVSGEITYFIREEMAVRLSDIIFRRSDLGTAQCPPGNLLKEICALMAKELQWDQQEQNRQLNEVYAVYASFSLRNGR